jgi:fluoroquinolone resistance protein
MKEKIYIEEKKFDTIDFTQKLFAAADYENCTFVNCNFSGTGLVNIVFAGCTFTDCNLSLATIIQTAFKMVTFKNCKLLGLHFENCNPFLFEVYFESCILNLSSFYKLKIKKTRFINCSLHEVDFTAADLTSAIFDKCDLTRAIFQNSIIEKADFSTAHNYSIDPEINKIKKAKFALEGVAGLLDKYDIEVC